jgi:hypothetical protein
VELGDEYTAAIRTVIELHNFKLAEMPGDDEFSTVPI